MTDLTNKTRLVCKPILNVKDVSASIDYYCSKLGFTKVFSWKDGVGFCDNGKLTFAEVQRDGANIMLSLQEHADDKGISLYLDLSSDMADLELLYREFKENRALVVEPPNDKPWHMREMLVKDLDANFLRVGVPLEH